MLRPTIHDENMKLTVYYKLVGGGEILRDEQIFVAHKAANPKRYPPSDTFLANYPREGGKFNKWSHGTDVMLQVYDDCCHVTPTLSFTNPAKYMYRSISRFGDWLLSKNAVLSSNLKQLSINDGPILSGINRSAHEESGDREVPLVDPQAGGEIIRAETDSIISSSSSSNSVSTKEDDLEGLEDPSTSSLGSHIDRVSSIKDIHLELPPFVNHMYNLLYPPLPLSSLLTMLLQIHLYFFFLSFLTF